MADEVKQSKTTQEALLTELLGDIGKLHDHIRMLEGSHLFKLSVEMKNQIQEVRFEREKLFQLSDKIRPMTIDGFDVTSKAPPAEESNAVGYIACIILGAVGLGIVAHFYPPFIGLVSQ